MATQQIADRLVELCLAGQYEQAQRELYAENAESHEADIVPAEYRIVLGLAAIVEKGAAFRNSIQEWHNVSVSNALVAVNHIALRIYMDVTNTDGQRSATDEIAVYTVQDGKIVKEQFFY